MNKVNEGSIKKEIRHAQKYTSRYFQFVVKLTKLAHIGIINIAIIPNPAIYEEIRINNIDKLAIILENAKAFTSSNFFISAPLKNILTYF